MRVLPLLVAILLAAALPTHAQTSGYEQPLRPQVHFSPQHNWTNDPNGLVYFHGEYHLFFQYNPFGDQWGHMSWGHAVSRDLLHWKELPVAIPELKTPQGTEMAFTGSIVVDEHNTSGLCTGNKPCMVAVYTGHHLSPNPADKTTLQNQNLAVSNDDGRTWQRYSGNPVLDLHLSDFRDPSVFRDEERNRWVMAVALSLEHKVRLYASADLKQWTPLSDFGPTDTTGGAWECPDLVRVPAERSEATMWALKVGLGSNTPHGGSGEQYFLGTFDGTRFTPSTLPGAHGWTNYGKDDYCAISFNHLPPDKEPRPILLGWMSNLQYASKLPTAPWRGQMSLPRRLSYISDEDGIALRQQPITEPLRGARSTISSARDLNRLPPFELSLTFDEKAPGTTGLRLYTDDTHYTEIAYDNTSHVFYTDRTRSGADVAPGFPARTTAPLAPNRAHDLRLIVDRISVESFAQQGTIAMTDLIFPTEKKSRIVFFTTTEPTTPATSTNAAKPAPEATAKPTVKGDLWILRSIWQQPSPQSSQP
ncbi:MAG: glycoside hydrolase family 32 protein [Edaphobacter sp.]|uniref:glycoside hydrolase family 32 protein n=1 Tax=Edaphobacter sp. TaxID=1934404 RepID=UPI0023948162|nr:glycoside hydrolase family 32 protein [Edaphobacter sp.]MDE1175859.1 glycoside hydrolase family 32 protein [Edaphobacter sp.]